MKKLFFLILIISTSFFSSCTFYSTESILIFDGSTLRISMDLIYQHKDTTMTCVPGADNTVHTWDHSLSACPHCSTYCAPASIAMISHRYGMGKPHIEQDSIYENGKFPTTDRNNNIIEIHGQGMFDIPSQAEVQDALSYALNGMQIVQYDISNPINEDIIKNDCILRKKPILWLDHNNWPASQPLDYPNEIDRLKQGHAKVIAGYDTSRTATLNDDYCLIYDPWPEYNEKGILPNIPNVRRGPEFTYDPYWVPISYVLSNISNDIFLVPFNEIY